MLTHRVSKRYSSFFYFREGRHAFGRILLFLPNKNIRTDALCVSLLDQIVFLGRKDCDLKEYWALAFKIQ